MKYIGTKLRDYQQESVERADRPAWAHFWEQGLGKTLAVIAQAARLYDEGKIDSLMIVAPNGLTANFIYRELVQHWDGDPPTCVCYQASRSTTRKHREEVEALFRDDGSLKVLAMNYEALTTADRKVKGEKVPGGFTTALRFLADHNAMMVLDEAHRVKNPSAKTTRAVMKLGKSAKYRRILTGTPAANGPFDLFAPVMFLQPEFWKSKGISSFSGFKTYFGKWSDGVVFRNGVRQTFPRLESYQNLDRLNRWLADISDRLTKDEVLDLPPKIYKRVVFDMSPAQRKAYDQLRDEAFMELEGGETVSALLPITLLLRLHQVACGYIPVEGADDQEMRVIDPKNQARLKVLREIAHDQTDKCIIWCRFRQDVDMVLQELKTLGKEAVRYDGSVGRDARTDAIERFQNGDAQFFVSTPSAGGSGLTLHAATTVIYYSQSMNLTERMQSEDRAHRIGQERPVVYIDLEARRTVDRQIIDRLSDKYDVAAQITGDELKSWLRGGTDDNPEV